MRKPLSALLVTIVALALAGCGGTDVYVKPTSTISKGRELQDLQRARGEGAISDDEYESLRRVILDRRN